MDKKKYLVVGETSFIGRHIYDSNFDKCSYKEVDHYDFSKYDVVVNCALNPLFKIQKYDETIDVDFEIGKKTYESGAHYVMISTSKVYGDSKSLKVYTENSAIDPFDYYGENKLNSEFKLFSNFGNKVTILRGSNIFGFEYGRNSFMGYCMSQLVNEGKITLTISELVQRDFIFVKDAVSLISDVCRVKPFGVYNFSSGVGTEVSTITKNLIKGYVYGGYVDRVNNVFDRQFILDNSKLKTALNREIGPFDFDEICYTLGKQLCKI